jgi:hypothetical protein
MRQALPANAGAIHPGGYRAAKEFSAKPLIFLTSDF